MNAAFTFGVAQAQMPDITIPWVVEVIVVVVVAVAGYLMGRQVERRRQRPGLGDPGSPNEPS
jgi:hypothetical protein